MKKNNVQVKDSLNIYEKIGMIDLIVDSYFTNGDYTPYFAEQSITTAIVTYMITGIEFDENESIYESAINDDDIKTLINECKETDAYDFVLRNVQDIVEVKKQKYIHNQNEINEFLSYVEIFAKALTNFANLNINQISKEDQELAIEFMHNMKDSDFTEDNIAAALQKVVKAHKEPNTKIYKEQKQYISELRSMVEQQDNELQELRKWKREQLARNVKA